ncbi:MAG: hypothetical protein B6D59_03020 [Campylobacteraceae bacterium 4484_4]|nr:MAG: hypothetical protein B6D59_03020 [Campylobacteraceae bacterium 4484_4]
MKRVTSTLLLSSSLFASLLLAQSATLPSILVTTPTKTLQPIEETTSNVDLVTSEEISEKGYQTIPEALHTLPGISYAANGGYGQPSSIYLRGFKTSKLLVLIDGIRLNDPTSLNGAAFEHLLSANIAQIEVVKGAQSGIWGADASAGVINIVTQNLVREGTNLSLLAEYGTHNTFRYGAMIGYKEKRFDIALKSSGLFSHGITAIVPPHSDVDDYEDDHYRNNTHHLKLGLNPGENDRIEASYMVISATTDYDNDPNWSATLAAKANNPTYTTRSKTQLYGLNYRHSFSKGDLKLYANRSDFTRKYPQEMFGKAYDGSVDTWGFQGHLTYRENGTLVAGAEQNRFKHENEIDHSYRNDGLFVTNTNTLEGVIGGKTILTESLRYDRYDAFSNKFTYKVGLKHFHKHIPGFWTSLNYGTGYNVPSLFHLYGPFGANPDLDPEKSRSFDITAHYKGVQITYFYNTLDEMIDYVMTDPTTYSGHYENVSGKSKFEGVELSWQKAIESIDSVFNFNYTWQRPRDKEGKALIRIPKNSANLSFDYYGIKDTHLGTQLHFVGKRTEYTGAKMGGYTLVDLSGDYSYSNGLDLFMRISNLLDKRYETAATYATPGRAVYAGIRYRLR